MTRIIESRRRFKSRLDAKQDVSRPIPALMGDGAGTIEVPNRPGYVYIRIGDGDLGQAFNNRVPRADNLAVDVGYDPITDPDRRIFQVLSVRMADYAGGGNTPYANVPSHHDTHEFGGGDDVFLSWRRLMGLRVGRPSGYSVTVDEGFILRAGAWLAVLAQTLDLTASKPALATQARYVLITLDSAGVATSTDGALVAVAALDISDCPIPAAGEIPLAAVRMYGTQTGIGDVPSAPDIIDLRFPQAASTGSVYLADLEKGAAQYQIITSGPNPYPATWSTFKIQGTAGGTTNLAVTNTKTLTLTATNDFNLTIPKTGTVPVGTGTAGRLAEWVTDINTLQASTLIKTGTNTLTLATGAIAALTWTIPANAAGVLTNDGAGALSWEAAGGDISGTGVVGRVAEFVTDTKTIQAANLIAPAANILTLTATAASTLALAITAAQTLTLTSAGSYNLTIPATGTAVLGSGASDSLTKWTTANTVSHIANAGGYLHNSGDGIITWQAAATSLPHNILSANHGDTTAAALVAGDVLYVNSANTLTRLAAPATLYCFLQFDTSGPMNRPFWSGHSFTGTAGGTTNFAVTNTKTLTLTATDNYNLTIPATGTVALLGVANAFTESNTIASGKFLTCLTDGNTGGLRAGSGSDVLLYRSAADMWRTPDGLTVDLGLNVGSASGAATGQVRSSGAMMPGANATYGYNIQTVLGLADDATVQISGTAAFFGFILATSTTDGTCAIFIANGGAHTTVEVSDPSTQWSNADTDTMNCIYWDGATYVLKNRRGAAKSYILHLFGNP